MQQKAQAKRHTHPMRPVRDVKQAIIASAQGHPHRRLTAMNRALIQAATA